MTSTDAPFDQDAIQITTTQIEPNDWRVEFEVPAEQVGRFARQLRAVKPEIHPQELATLLIQVAMDEASHRLDRDRLWPYALVASAPPPIFHRDKPFVGTFDCDGFVMPEWPDFSLLTLSLPGAEVDDALVEREMLDQRLDAGTRAPLTGPLAEGDECDVSAEVHLPESEAPVISVPRRPVRIPPAGHPLNLGGLLLRGGEALVGHAAGESVTIETELPTGLPSPELDGRRATVHLTIHETRRITPAEESEVVARFGSPNAANLRMQIRFALEQRLADERRVAAGRQILEQLRALVPLQVPSRIVADRVERRCATIRETLAAEGHAGDELESRLAEARTRVEETAQAALATQAIMALLRLHLDVQHSEDDVLAEIRRLAAQTGRRPEDLRNQLVEQGTLSSVEQTVVLGRITDEILPQATVL